MLEYLQFPVFTSTNIQFQDCERAVSTEEGMALAEEKNSLFFECSAKTRANVHLIFKELIVKVYILVCPLATLLFALSL